MTEQSKVRWEKEERRGEWNPEQLSAKERQDRATHESNTKRIRTFLEDLEERRAELRELVNRDAHDIGADRNPGVPGG